jgi:outer membrane protein assembly factor BamB
VRCLECAAETADAGQFCHRCGAPTRIPAISAATGPDADPVPSSAGGSRATRRRRAVIAFAAGIAVIGLLTAIGVNSGPSGRISSAPSRPKTHGTPTAPATPATSARWIYTTGFYVDGQPAVADGTVYFGDENGKVYALDAATGRPRWIYTSGDYGLSGPTVTDGVVYVSSEFGKVYALDGATGRLRWIYTTGEMQDSGPAVVHGTVYVGSDDAKVFALKARS